MNYAMPTDAVAYEEGPTAAAQLLKNSEYSLYPLRRTPDPETTGTPVQAAALIPSCWRSLVASATLPLTQFVPDVAPRGPAYAVIFLHERISPGGHHRLVCVTYAPNTDMFQPSFIQAYNYDAWVASPAKWTGPITVMPTSTDVEVKSDYARRPPLVRVYIGQSDPNDPSHFTIRYQMWGQDDVLDGRLQDDDQVTLTPRRLPQEPRN
jgi:hypothetical protein